MHTGTEAVEELFADLNEPQREAVAHTDGPLLILAGPGSGKTRVITRRAAHLARTVAKPWNILAITFTNKAAREMRERIDALGVGEGMTVCTFHALCAKLLRWHHERARIPRNFSIFDTDDRRKVLKQAIERANLSAENLTPASAEQHISRAKNALQNARQFAEENEDWRGRQIARVFEIYEAIMNEQGALDFDDLLLRTALVLSHDDELRDQLEDRFRYVLIDEYQDTNDAQYQIARRLTQRKQNLCATGDPDQSIYGWRGANIGNILSFERDFPRAKVVRLEENYRSSKRILAAADSLIARNQRRKNKKLWTQNDEGPAVSILECEDAEEEAERVVGAIAQRIREGVDPGEIAVFYRVNSLSRTVEEALFHAGLRYQIARGVEFYNRKEIKDVLAYLRVLLNPADELSLDRILNMPPRGIGTTTVERLTESARTSGRRLADVLTDDGVVASLGRSGVKVREFGALLRNLSAVLELPPSRALDRVISESGLRAHYHQQREVDAEPLANLDELINAAATFEQEHPDATLLDWLEHAALVSDVDAVENGAGAVTLMTLHAAKGLEFDHVNMIGLEDGLLPFRRMNGENDTDEEEERRLCFVGMTRARKTLTMSRARYRMKRGFAERTVSSPFLDELPAKGVQWTDTADNEEEEEDGRSRRSARVAPPQGRLPEDIEAWEVGTLVRHPIYGLGQVTSLHRGPRRTHVDVRFKGGGEKSWVLEFAELTRVEFEDVEEEG